MSEQHRAIAEQIKMALSFKSSEEDMVAQLTALYHPDVEFQDPMQKIKGRDAYIEGGRRFIRHVRNVRFSLDHHDVVESGDQVVVTWTWNHSILHKSGPEFHVEGISHIKLRDGQIAYQRDYWDLASTALSNIPVVGTLYKKFLGTVAKVIS